MKASKNFVLVYIAVGIIVSVLIGAGAYVYTLHKHQQAKEQKQ